jgi:signal transduction histidine kinase
MSYGGSYTDPFRQAGVYTGRILRGEMPLVPGDRIQLQQVILNLIVNAVDVIPGGRV